MDSEKETTPEKKKQDNLKSYMRYSGLAFQMIGALVIAAYAGQKLDKYLENQNPWATIFFMLLAVVASIYMIIVSVIRNNSNNQK